MNDFRAPISIIVSRVW